MENCEKKRVAKLSVRIVLTFLMAFCILIFTACFVLSRNFQKLLTDYTVKLIQTMVDQGVTAVESELSGSLGEAAELSDSLLFPADGAQAVFPQVSSHSDILRMIYASEDSFISSDNRQTDPRNRTDILEALAGKSSVYGPYFNAENEYVICYSVPVIRDGKVAGAFCIEKDGYYFCELIRSILFADTGEAYIINADGTDIAVSAPEHISWVNDSYNARKLLEEKEDAAVRSVMELEQKGLRGDSGAGTYYWEDSLCYVVYAPVASVHWVLLAGVRQEELVSMMKTALFSSIANGPVLGVCLAVFFVLAASILFWIVSSTKRSAEITEKLNFMANYDTLTGIMNRNSFHSAMETYPAGNDISLACIYLDVNGLHEINNRLGHQAGDTMLLAAADALQRFFTHSSIYRIGGDEFAVLCKNTDKPEIFQKADAVRQALRKQGYEISIGIEWRDKDLDMNRIVETAEKSMQQDKQKYYQENGKERQMRILNQELEQILLDKQDADTFISVLAPEFKGVYFVDMGKDTIRHLYLPSYFEELLEETDERFSAALMLYADRIITDKHRQQFKKFCNYSYLERQLKQNKTPEYTYQKVDGTWIALRILKFKAYTEQSRETLWIFSAADGRN